MPFIDVENDRVEFAKCFSQVNISRTQFLGFRDIPGLIRQHVHGINSLDYGSGAGRSSMFLRSLGLDVEGVDNNAAMISLAKEQDPAGKYRLILSGKIPTDNNRYDLVFASWVFVQVGSKLEILKILREITRVLETGGTFITINGNRKYYDNADWFTSDTQFEENKNLVSGSRVKLCFKTNNLTIQDYYWSDTDYQELMEEAGLSVVQAHNPLGKDSDGFNWRLERTKSPYTIFVAKKRGTHFESKSIKR